MPQVNDSSDYTRRLKLRAVSIGGQVANARKPDPRRTCNTEGPSQCGLAAGRAGAAGTTRGSYDPSIFRNAGGKCNDLCFTVKHSIANLMRLPYKAPANIRDRYGSFGGVRS